MAQQLWAGIDAGKLAHHCVVVDADGTRVFSRRVTNDEATLGELITEVTHLADDGELTWAIDLAGGGAALLITLLLDAADKAPGGPPITRTRSGPCALRRKLLDALRGELGERAVRAHHQPRDRRPSR